MRERIGLYKSLIFFILFTLSHIGFAGVSAVTMDAGGIPFLLDEKGSVWAYKKAFSLEEPVKLMGLDKIIKIAPYIALRSDGKIFTWALDSAKTTASSSSEILAFYTQPKLANAVDDITQIASMPSGEGTRYLALRKDGVVFEALTKNSGSNISWDIVEGLPKIVAISGSLSTTLALGENGLIYGWGLSSLGQFNSVDYPKIIRSNKPASWKAPQGTKDIYANTNHSIALTKDGHAYYWGSCSRNDIPEPKTFVKAEIDSLDDIALIAIHDFSSDNFWPNIYIRSDGTIWLAFAPNSNDNEPNQCGESFAGGVRHIQLLGLEKNAVAAAAGGSSELLNNILIIDQDHNLWAGGFSQWHTFRTQNINLKNNFFHKVNIENLNY